MTARWTLGSVFLVTACGPGEGTVLLSADQNYDFTSSLDVEVQEIEAGQDATVDWSELSVDQLSKEITPSESRPADDCSVEGPEQAEVLDLAAKDCLKQKDDGGVVEVFPEDTDTQALLSDFQLIGYNVDPAEQFQEDMGTFVERLHLQDMDRGPYVVIPGAKLGLREQLHRSLQRALRLIMRWIWPQEIAFHWTLPHWTGRSLRFQRLAGCFPSTNSMD